MMTPLYFLPDLRRPSQELKTTNQNWGRLRPPEPREQRAREDYLRDCSRTQGAGPLGLRMHAALHKPSVRPRAPPGEQLL